MKLKEDATTTTSVSTPSIGDDVQLPLGDNPKSLNPYKDANKKQEKKYTLKTLKLKSQE